MSKILLVLIALVVVACSKTTDVVTVTGNDGKNGYSVVSEYAEASELECEVSGTRLDLYLDLDQSLSTTPGDKYLNSLVACNGANGINGINGVDGEQGPQGEMGPQGLQGLTGPMGPQGLPGLQGPTGPVGPQGPQGLPGVPGANGSSGATIVSYSSSSCTLISGTTSYVKVGNNNSGIYSSSSCHSNTKVAEVSQGESYWVSNNALAIHNTNSLRVITFN